MADGPSSNGKDDYDIELQRLMHSCLPPILVQIVEDRPQDPIEYLAQSLYRYRGREASLNMPSTDQQTPVRTEQQTVEYATATSNRKSTTECVTGTSAGNLGWMITENCETDELVSDSIQIKAPSVILHEIIKPILQTIGDIFDDDDIS